MPNHTCCVPGCQNRHAETKGSGIRYYKFPKHKRMQCLWKRMVTRERIRTLVVTANTRVCSVHFVGGVKSENCPIPTLFPWKKSNDDFWKSLAPPKRVKVLSALQESMQTSPQVNDLQICPQENDVEFETSPSVNDAQICPEVNDVQTSPLVNDVLASSLVNDILASPQVNDLLNSPLVNDVLASPLVNDMLASPQVNDLLKSPLVNDVLSSPLVNDMLASPQVNDVLNSPLVNDVQTSPQVNHMQAMLSPMLRQNAEVYSNKAVQTEGNGLFIHALLDYIERLESKNTSLRSQLISHTFCIERFSDNDHDIAYYTGFPNYDTLMTFWHYLGDKVDHLIYWRGYETNFNSKQTSACTSIERKLKPLDEFFMCLMRLRLGLQIVDLSFRFGISPSSVSRIFTTWINFLYLEFKAIDCPPTREQIKRDMPLCFKAKYPTTRLILDATEIALETPSSLEMQSLTWSAYKNTNTLKGLIGITPAGYISFVSKLYCGNISDKTITAESGVLDFLQAGDGLMADRGFDIGEECIAHDIDLNIPPFRYGRGQLSSSEVVETRRIASLRIHVERAIKQIKNYHIFQSAIPISMTNTIDQVFYVCCMLTKFRPPLIS